MFCEIKERELLFEGEVKLTFDEIIECLDIFESDVVYLAGSLIEGCVDKYAKGMGNPCSDLDIFVIRESHEYKSTVEYFEQYTNKVYFRVVNDMPLHIDVYDKAYVSALFDILPTIRFKKNGDIAQFEMQGLCRGSNYEFANTFLNRMRYSVGIHNENEHFMNQSAIEQSQFLRAKVALLSNYVDSYSVDVEGNLLVSEFDVALQSLRNMLMLILEIVLAKEGVSVDRTKWVALKFSNLARESNKYKLLHNLYKAVFRGKFMNDSENLLQLRNLFANAECEIEKMTLEELRI